MGYQRGCLGPVVSVRLSQRGYRSAVIATTDIMKLNPHHEVVSGHAADFYNVRDLPNGAEGMQSWPNGPDRLMPKMR